jgi:heat-inducible transcriptional repressor
MICPFRCTGADRRADPLKARPIDGPEPGPLHPHRHTGWQAMEDGKKLLAQMNDRSREVFRRVVEGYLESGDPVGSRTLTRTMSEKVSAATVRNVMQDLEYLGLLGSPHVSAGRIPTQMGLRMFVDGLLEIGDLTAEDRDMIDASADGQTEVSSLLDRVSSTLSGITRGASLVLAPKHEAPIKHIEFVGLDPQRVLVVLVFADGHVENRIFHPPPGQTPASLREAANFLNAVAEGRTLSELSRAIAEQVAARRQELDVLARDLVETGMAIWENKGESGERLIVRGRANLLGDGPEAVELERVRELFDDLERKRDIAEFLSLTEQGEGVRIFIGSENKLFSLSGSSLVVSPYMNADRKIIGAVGVIGPTRLNYGRIVPIVDYTAQLVGRLLADRT